MKKFIIDFKTREMGKVIQNFLFANGYEWVIGDKNYLNLSVSGIGNFDGSAPVEKKLRYGYDDDQRSLCKHKFDAETQFGDFVKFITDQEKVKEFNIQ